MLVHNLQNLTLQKPLNDVQDPLFEKQGRSETEVGPQSICKFSAQLSTSKSLRDVSHQISLPQDMSSCIDWIAFFFGLGLPTIVYSKERKGRDVHKLSFH